MEMFLFLTLFYTISLFLFMKIFLCYRLCTDLQTLIQERAEIEKGYAKNLRTWSKKWSELIEKGNYNKFVYISEKSYCIMQVPATTLPTHYTEVLY